jgi:putative ABC transport system ATP-binding protein
MIKIANLEKTYRTEEVETVALNKLSFEIKEGEFVALWVHRDAVSQPC